MNNEEVIIEDGSDVLNNEHANMHTEMTFSSAPTLEEPTGTETEVKTEEEDKTDEPVFKIRDRFITDLVDTLGSMGYSDNVTVEGVNFTVNELIKTFIAKREKITLTDLNYLLVCISKAPYKYIFTLLDRVSLNQEIYFEEIHNGNDN